MNWPLAFRLAFFLPLLFACTPAARNPVEQNPALTTAAPIQEYRIHTSDQLEIKFFYNNELNELVTVRPDGRISLQLVGEVQVAGMTPAAVTQLLMQKYATDIANPELTVIVRTFSSQNVYVDGEVNRAGMIPLTSPTTVLQAIAQAGGMKDTAHPDGVLVLRKTADNRVMTMTVDLEKALDGDKSQDVLLMPNDIVFVPLSTVASVNKWIDQYIRRNIPIPIGFGFNMFGN